MASLDIQAALEGKGKYLGKSYFFKENQYTRYDWTADRSEDGYPLEIDLWDLKSSFGDSVNAALNGKGVYKGKAYFFKGDSYCRYNWSTDKVDANYPMKITAWKLPKGFESDLDGAVNGKGRFKGKAYFFKGGEYVRYDWLKDAADPGYPKNLSEWGLPAHFQSGIDCIVNGQGAYKNKAYFFKGDEYARYDWNSDSVEAVAKVVGNWPMLTELTNAGSGKAQALEWLVAAMPQVKALISSLSSGTSFPHNQALMDDALETHFKIPKTMKAADKLKHLPIIQANFEAVHQALLSSHKSFRGRILSEAVSDRGVDTSGNPFPAYTWHVHSMNFTRTFANFGPLCQAAMVLHESVHFVDVKATAANDFYEHSPKYATMSIVEALHNPSSYVCFAQHLFYGKDERFGAARPNL
ncbi:MAG: hemopexin repeat-containing protein [Bacteroidota bacterium]